MDVAATYFFETSMADLGGFSEDRLLVYRELHWDGFSTSIAARDLLNGRAIALKIFDFNTFKFCSKEAREKYRIEYREIVSKTFETIKSLPESTYRLQFLNYLDRPKQFLVFTDMCSFGDLMSWILHHSKLNIPDIFCVMQSLFSALKYFHENNFVHGKIQPNTIYFRNPSPQSLTLAPDTSFRHFFDMKERKIGRLEMFDCWSPEKLQSSIEFNNGTSEMNYEWKTPATDVWSAGLICLFLCIGTSPKRTDDLKELLDFITENPYNVLIRDMDISSKFPENFVAYLEKCLNINPSDRPTSATMSTIKYPFKRIETESNLMYQIEFNLLSTTMKYQWKGINSFLKNIGPDTKTKPRIESIAR